MPRPPVPTAARRRRTRRWALIAAVVLPAGVLLGLLAVTRSSGPDEANDANQATPPVARTQAGLCTALGLADDDDMSGARAAFYDRSHDGLHQLAARATDVDPTVAARLLEVMQRVEALLEVQPARADLTSVLASLADATARAAEVVGEPNVHDCG